MKKCLLILLTIVSIPSFSQKEMEVIKFGVSTSDISARTNQREDTKGESCALIKVQLPVPNASFEGDIIGRVSHKINEYWVYMPQNSTNLTILLFDYTPLSVEFKDYGIDNLISKETYELCILPKVSNAPQLYDEGMKALATNDVVTAYEKLEKAANAGYPYAYYILGSIQIQPYESWDGSDYIADPNPVESYQAAYDYYKKAADANIPEALYALGKFLTHYKEVKGEEKIDGTNIYKANVLPEDCSPTYISSLIQKAADMGFADAQWEMSKDRRWCEENAKKGIAIAEFVMGLRCDSTAFDGDEDFPHAPDIGRSFSASMEHLKYAAYKSYFQKKGYIEAEPSEWKHEAFEWYKKAAEKGLDAAQWKLGYMYALGLGVEKNLENSTYWRKKAAEQGNAVYQFEVAMSYTFGVISDYSTFFSWGTAENGMRPWEAEIPKNADEADYWLRKASNYKREEEVIIDCQGMYPACMIELAKLFEKKKDFEKAIYWYQRNVEYDGEYKESALGELGRIFIEGLGGRKDYSIAKKYLEMDESCFLTECYLGILYRDGLGVEKDIEKAKAYFMKSIGYASWEPQPYYELANTYYLQEKYEDAVKWYRKAAEQGDASAQSQLGVMYAFGLGVPQNENEAAKWWRKAAEQGDAVGQFNYASVFVGKKDYNEAVKWLRKAAEQGFDEANKQLKILEKYIR